MPEFVTHSEFARLETRVDDLEHQRAITEQVRDDVDELLRSFREVEPGFRAFQDVQAGLRVLGWIGRAAKPVFWLVSAVAALLAVSHGSGK